MTSQRPASPSSPSAAPNLSIHGPALSGWQFHQSHGQVTVVFYVAVSARQEDLDVSIASNHVVAGIRGYPPVLKASLYAQVDPAASSWHLERSPTQSARRGHRSSNSRTRRQASNSNSGNDDTSSSEGRQPSSSSPHAYPRSTTSSTSSPPRPHSRQRSHESTASAGAAASSGTGPRSTGSSSGRSASPSNSASSYELLRASQSSLPPRRTPSSPARSAGSDIVVIEGEHQAHSREPSGTAAGAAEGSSPPPTSRPPTTAASPSSPRSPPSPRSPYSTASRISTGPSDLSSEPEELVAPLSLQSSVHFGTATSEASSGGRRSGQLSSNPDEDDDAMHARLVTVHLTKIDVGMWPSLISGPAPLSPSHARGSMAIPGAADGGRRRSIAGSDADAALSNSPGSVMSSSLDSDAGEATVGGGSWRRRGRSGTRYSAGESTLSVQSDDSHTVLAYGSSPMTPTSAQRRGRQGHGGEDDDDDIAAGSSSNNEDDEEDEARFNMDPVSLVLIGLQARASSASPAAPTDAAAGWDDGFEYFVRSWRTAALPTATRILVQCYLPLPLTAAHKEQRTRPSTDDPPTAPPRMVAALGGRKALARLYIAYARLALSSSSTSTAAGGVAALFPTGSGHCRDPYTYTPAHAIIDTHGHRAQALSSPPPPFSSPSAANSPPPLHSPPTAAQLSLSDAERVLQQGPLAYLSEARRLDLGASIEEHEWEEARQVAAAAALEVEAERVADEEASREDEENDEGEEGGFFAFAGARRRQTRRRRVDSAEGAADEKDSAGRARGSKTKARRGGGGGDDNEKDAHRRKTRRAGGNDVLDDDGFVVNVISGAALVSFAVAGGMAVLGWWKRGPGAAAAAAAAAGVGR